MLGGAASTPPGATSYEATTLGEERLGTTWRLWSQNPRAARELGDDERDLVGTWQHGDVPMCLYDDGTGLSSEGRLWWRVHDGEVHLAMEPSRPLRDARSFVGVLAPDRRSYGPDAGGAPFGRRVD